MLYAIIYITLMLIFRHALCACFDAAADAAITLLMPCRLFAHCRASSLISLLLMMMLTAFFEEMRFISSSLESFTPRHDFFFADCFFFFARLMMLLPFHRFVFRQLPSPLMRLMLLSPPLELTPYRFSYH